MSKLLKVSAIVPVYNEEKMVAEVIKVLIKSTWIDEIIVVNDGSTDDSLEKIQKLKEDFKLIDLKKNQGKGHALVKGIKLAKNPVVAFIDADLVNLNQDYLIQLIEPVIKYHWRGSIGIRKKGKILPAPFARLSGERVYYKKDLIPHYQAMAKSRFGVEVFFNHTFEKWPIKKLYLVNLRSLYKYEKYSLAEAIKEYLNEGAQIAKELARNEKLISSDIAIIDKLKEVVDVDDLKARIEKIKNKKVKQYLAEYVLKYLKQARDWFSKS